MMETNEHSWTPIKCYVENRQQPSVVFVVCLLDYLREVIEVAWASSFITHY